MTTTEALALTAKPIPDDLAQHFFTEVRQRLNDGEIIGREMLCRWCETHKDRLTALNEAEIAEIPVEDHNPDGLDADTIGIADGWRLLNKSEIINNVPSLEAIEIFRSGPAPGWNKGWHGSLPCSTYRTRLTVEELAALRKATAWRGCCNELR